MLPHVADGWLVVPYDGPEIAVIEIGWGGQWRPAFLDHEGAQRTAMIRHDGPLPWGKIRVRAAGRLHAEWDIPRSR